VRRLVTAWLAATVVFVAAACGTAASGPAVTVGQCTPSGSPSRSVYSFALAPLDQPSGTVTLTLVGDGRMRTLWTARFLSLAADGACTVTCTPETRSAGATVSAHVHLPGQPDQTSAAFVVPRRRFTGSGAIWNDQPLSVLAPVGKRVIFVQSFDVSASGQGATTTQLGSLSAIVRASTQQPLARAYCLTVQVTSQ